MLSYYLSWHMQARLAPLLFIDETSQRPGRPDQPGRPGRPLPARPGQGRHQAHPGDLPVHSFTSLLADLGTICLNTIAPADPALPGFRLVTTPTASSGRPSSSSASATASGSRSQQPGPHTHESPGKRPNTRITGGNFGLKRGGGAEKGSSAGAERKGRGGGDWTRSPPETSMS